MGHILRCLLGLVMLSRAIASVVESFESNSVVPDVVPVAPQELCCVKYLSGAEVKEGNVFTPTQVKDVPTVTWEAEPDAFYTIAMIDADAPSRSKPLFREFLHWLVGNIKGNNVASGEVLAAYVSPDPPPGTGPHRYVFVVYEQPKELEFDEPELLNTATEIRQRFSIAKFAKKYNLGDPTTGNFFTGVFSDLLQDDLSEQLGV